MEAVPAPAKSISRGKKLYKFLKRNPEEYDLAFCVGPEMKEVLGLKILLMAASTVFEKEYNENWKSQIILKRSQQKNYGEGGERFQIPLPELDPLAFQLFIKLVILDAWSYKELKGLQLPAEELLNLINVCLRFGMMDEVKDLESLFKILIWNFEALVQTDAFLRLTPVNLEKVLSSDSIPMEETDIFAYVYRWAENKCSKIKLKATGEHIREILGSALYQIRFSCMSVQDFDKVTSVKNILTAAEKSEIHKLMAMEEEAKLNYDGAQFPFSRKPRVKIQSLSLTKPFKVVSYPAFLCNGTWFLHNIIQPSQKIAIHSIGFAGPIDTDASYEISVEVIATTNGCNTKSSGKLSKAVFARKGRTFYFVFDEPFTMEAGALVFFNWNNYYQIRFSLHGPITGSIERADGEQAKLMVGETEFGLQFHSKQLAEVRFIKI